MRKYKVMAVHRYRGEAGETKKRRGMEKRNGEEEEMRRGVLYSPAGTVRSGCPCTTMIAPSSARVTCSRNTAFSIFFRSPGE